MIKEYMAVMDGGGSAQDRNFFSEQTTADKRRFKRPVIARALRTFTALAARRLVNGKAGLCLPQFPLALVTSLLLVGLSGCAAGVTMVGAGASAALQAVGIGKPDVPDAQKPPRKVMLSLDAGGNLNAGSTHKPLALIVRLYALKDPTSFMQAPFNTFIDPNVEKQVLGQDLLQVRELTMIPGQHYSSVEKVPYEAGAFGIVALFREPAAGRWRMTFDPKKSEKTGILVGLHGCAMTVTAGTIIDAQQGTSQQSLNMLSMVNCGANP